MILPNFPKNCMKLRKILGHKDRTPGRGAFPLGPPLRIELCLHSKIGEAKNLKQNMIITCEGAKASY